MKESFVTEIGNLLVIKFYMYTSAVMLDTVPLSGHFKSLYEKIFYSYIYLVEFEGTVHSFPITIK